MTKTMFDDNLGHGTLEVRDRHDKLLARKSVDLDTFSIRNFAQHLREGLTLSLYRLPLEFDALAIKNKTTHDVNHQAPPSSDIVGAVVTSKKGPVLNPVDDLFKELDTEIPSISVSKPRKPEISEAWGYTIDMGYSRHFKADVRINLADHLEMDRSNVNDKHKLSALGLVGPKKLPALFAHFNIADLPLKPNFAKMTFKQFVGLLHYQNTVKEDTE